MQISMTRETMTADWYPPVYFLCPLRHWKLARSRWPFARTCSCVHMIRDVPRALIVPSSYLAFVGKINARDYGLVFGGSIYGTQTQIFYPNYTHVFFYYYYSAYEISDMKL